MARCLSTLSQGITLFFNRRAYSTAASATEKMTTMVVKSSNTTSSASDSASTSSSSLLNSWVPDPVTGYYRPSNVASQVDAAELRAMLLSRYSNSELCSFYL